MKRAALLASLAFATPAASAGELPDIAANYLGKTMWTAAKSPISLCDKPMGGLGAAAPHCQRLPADTPLRFEQAIYKQQLGLKVIDGYRVSLPGGRTGFIGDTAPIYLTSDGAKKERDASRAACARKGGVAVGMTKAQVYASCWGRPARINETLTAGGRHEQWVFGGGYLYLDNGVVTAVQTSH